MDASGSRDTVTPSALHPVLQPIAASRSTNRVSPCRERARQAVHHDRAAGDSGDGQRVAGRRGVGLDAVRRCHVAPLVDLDRVVADTHVAAAERRHHRAGHLDVRPRHERTRQLDAKPAAQVGTDQHQRRHELARDVTADRDAAAGGRSGDLDRQPSRRRERADRRAELRRARRAAAPSAASAAAGRRRRRTGRVRARRAR